jgi:hypothetical protein
VSDDFDSLDASEKAAVEAALNRCRVLAGQIESKLRNKTPEHFVDEFSLADFCRCPRTEKSTAGLQHTCSRGEGPAGAGPPAPSIVAGNPCLATNFHALAGVDRRRRFF